MTKITNPARNAIARGCALLLLGLISGAAPFVRGPMSLEEIQGRWDLVSATFRGEPLHLKSCTLELKGDLLTLTRVTEMKKMRFSVDTAVIPGTLDRTILLGTNERKLKEVFEVSATRLIVCGPSLWTRDDATRPKSLDSTPGSKTKRQEWQRLGPAPPDGSSIAQQLEGKWVCIKNMDEGVESSPPVKTEIIWDIQNGEIGGEGKFVEEYKLSLEEGSARADLSKIADERKSRAFIDFDPATRVLKIARRAGSESDYPTEFVSTPSNNLLVEVFKKEAPKTP